MFQLSSHWTLVFPVSKGHRNNSWSLPPLTKNGKKKTLILTTHSFIYFNAIEAGKSFSNFTTHPICLGGGRKDGTTYLPTRLQARWFRTMSQTVKADYVYVKTMSQPVYAPISNIFLLQTDTYFLHSLCCRHIHTYTTGKDCEEKLVNLLHTTASLLPVSDPIPVLGLLQNSKFLPSLFKNLFQNMYLRSYLGLGLIQSEFLIDFTRKPL